MENLAVAPQAQVGARRTTGTRTAPGAQRGGGIDRAHRRVILAASLGTVFEWYDFYLYGSLVSVIGAQFFAGVNETTAFIFALLAFAAGFAVRPLGALVFGRLGDLLGRKYTFLVTILIMGVATALVGVLPVYAQIGVAAPVLLISLRLLQGLAIGGEYGGAATYVAEHAGPNQRGYYTGWVQTTAVLGLVLSLLVILGCRLALGPAFDAWGWRIPFLVSVLLLAISVYIRLQLEESPVFQEMRDEGKLASAPVSESFGQWSNLKLVLLALFGATAGQAVVSYVSLIYMQLFLQQTLKVDPNAASLLTVLALLVTTPLFIVFGKLSDRIGRKPVVMTGMFLAVATFFWIFHGLTHYANPALERAQQTNPVVVVADPAKCSFQFDPIGKASFRSSCDLLKTELTRQGVPYANEAAPAGSVALLRVGSMTTLPSFEGEALAGADFDKQRTSLREQLRRDLDAAGYPPKAAAADVDYFRVFLLLALIGVYGALVYGPLAAWLVELFPARIRYTSLSLPYHIGNGWFGGFLPSISFALISYTGNIYQGLWYPISVAVLTLVVGTFFLRETRGTEID